MTTIRIRLAGPPMQKERPRVNNKTGNVYTPQRTLNYEAMLRARAQDVMTALAIDPLTGPVKATLTLTMPTAKSWSKRKTADALSGAVRPIGRPDLDNVAKLADSLNMVVFMDDSQIVEFHAYKKYGAAPGLELVIETL